MLRSLIAIMVLFSTSTAFAQFQKRNVLLEGSLGYTMELKSKLNPDDYKQPYQFDVGITGGLFVNSKTEIGIGLSYGKSRRNATGIVLTSSGLPFTFSTVTNSFTYAGRLFARRYKSLSERLYFASTASISGGISIFGVADFAVGVINEDQIKTATVGYSPSLVYMASKKIGIRGSFGYLGVEYYNFLSDEEVWQGNFFLDFSPQNLNFGIFLLLNDTNSNDRD